MNFRQTGRKRKNRRVVAVESILKTACLFFCAAGILSVALLRSNETDSLPKRDRIMITAHRGASYGAPENTRASVALGIAEKADYVEIDVRLTADGVPVLMHDRALFRTTGVVNEIDKVTYAELGTYDVGCRYAERYTGETVPCLREILEVYGRKVKFNIELKDGESRELTGAVAALIKDFGLERRCVVTSASYAQLELVKKLNGNIKTGYIISLVYGEIFGYEAADFFSVKSDCITEQLVKSAHAKGKEIHAWTVNKAYEIKRMQELGVDNIITDKPAYVREILNGHATSERKIVCYQ